MSISKDTPEKLKVYEALGLEFSINGKDAKAECPFCGKYKFHIVKDTGQYRCVVCNSKGNKVQLH